MIKYLIKAISSRSYITGHGMVLPPPLSEEASFLFSLRSQVSLNSLTLLCSTNGA